MRKLAALFIVLFLFIGSSLMGTSKLQGGEKTTCLKSQFEVQIGPGEIMCVNNIDIQGI